MAESRGLVWTLGAFLLAATCLFAALGRLPLIDPDEGRNASVAMEMQTTGAWLIPTYDGLAYLDKPAFFFRTVAISFSLFGESEASARLPSALFGFTLLLMVWAFCQNAYGWRTAALAVAVLATTPLFVAMARIVIMDMTLALAVWSAIFAGFIAEEKEGRERMLWYLAGAVAAGIATVIKGPVGFLLPSLALLIFSLVERRKGVVRRMLSPLNVAVFLVIVLAWFFGVVHARPDFFHYGLVEESLQRFTTPSFHRTGPFYYYVPVIAALFFPWSTLLPESVVAGWQARGRASRADRMLATAAIVITGFFSLSQSKLPAYVLPALVALGILVARIFDLALQQKDGRAHGVVLRGVLLLVLVSATFAALLAIDLFHLGDLAGILHLRAVGVARWQGFFAPVFWTFAGAAVAGCVALALRSCRAAFAVYVLFPIALLLTTSGALNAYADANSSRALALHIQSTAPSAQTLFLECFATGLPFYTRHSVFLATFDGHETTSNYISDWMDKNPAWPRVMIHPEQVPAWLDAQQQPVYVIARVEQREQLEMLAAARGAAVKQAANGWWGALVPPRGAR